MSDKTVKIAVRVPAGLMARVLEKFGGVAISDAVRAALEQYADEFEKVSPQTGFGKSRSMDKRLKSQGAEGQPYHADDPVRPAYVVDVQAAVDGYVSPHRRDKGHNACWLLDPVKHQSCTDCCVCAGRAVKGVRK